MTDGPTDTAGVSRPDRGAVRAGATRGGRLGTIDRFKVFWMAPALLWQLAFFVAPLIFLVWMTFWRVSNFRLTPDFILDNWQRIFSSGFFYGAFEHTFVLAFATAVLASVIAFPASYFLAFRASETVRRLTIVALITPFFTSYLVRTYSMQIILAEHGILNHALGRLGLGPLVMLGNSFGTLVGYLMLTLPLVLIVQLLTLSAVDRRLVEAAANLGCGPLATVFKVIVPAARVGLLMAATFAFLLSFGDYVSPLFLGGSRPPTLSILIADQVKSGNQWPRAAVVAVVMVVTLVAVLLAMTALAYGRRRSS